MNKLVITGVLLYMIFAVSCKKDENGNDEPTPQPVSAYLQLSPGNYWVYEHYKIDSLGNETQVQRTDSIVITGDTMINNQLYYIFEGTMFGASPRRVLGYFRDSAKHLVNHEGWIAFSETNFSHPINSLVDYHPQTDTLFTSHTLMEDPGTPVTVPAGTFTALNAKYYLTLYYHNMNLGDEIGQVGLNKFFGQGVGEILYEYIMVSEYYHDKTTRGRRLVRYSVAM